MDFKIYNCILDTLTNGPKAVGHYSLVRAAFFKWGGGGGGGGGV